MHARRSLLLAGVGWLVLVGGPSGAAAQTPPTPTPEPPPSPVLADARVHAPGAVAPGGRLRLTVTGMPRPIRLQQRVGEKWINRGEPITRPGGVVTLRASPTARSMRLRALAPDRRISRSRTITIRPLRLAAVGDINFGDGPGTAISRFGTAYPWASVGPRLRAADIAFGNLECAVSLRGHAQIKQYTFRGHPSAITAARRHGGLDVVNLANNHSGDYGTLALLDTLKYLRRSNIVPVGAGATAHSAYAPAIIQRLGLRVAFVGFSTILPFEFQAIGTRPGSAWAYADRVRDAVRRARRDADIVIATFHWGIERDTTESPQQRQLAQIALNAGATAIIGAHPHVLQPVRRPDARRLIAYSLGNFVFSASSPTTTRTAILELDLNARGVDRHRMVPATIVGSRPVLRGR